MYREERFEKVVLSREDYIWYQQRRKECKVYDPNEVQFRAFNPKKKYYNKR
jgi:hypothetical protein